MTTCPPSFFHMEKITSDLASIFYAKIYKLEHIADFYRLLVLYKLGGVYLDLDSWLTHDLTSYLNLKVPTLGHSGNGCVSNAFIAAPADNQFIGLWLMQYKFYSESDYQAQLKSKKWLKIHVKYWSKFSVNMAYFLSKLHPNLVNLEDTKIMRPSKFANTNFKQGYFDWALTHHVAVHASESHFEKMGYIYPPKNYIYFEDIYAFNCIETSLAELARLILFGDFRSCHYLMGKHRD